MSIVNRPVKAGTGSFLSMRNSSTNVLKSEYIHFCAFICSEVKFIFCVSGGFVGGLLPVLPGSRQKRSQAF